MPIAPFKIKGNAQVEGNLTVTTQTANRALTTDGSNNIVSSSVTSTELGQLSGVTSNVQTQLNAKINSTEKGVANGVATLDAGGKVPVAQLPNSVMEYQGAWNASTNTPTLADGTGNTGDLYRVSVAGSQTFGGVTASYGVGDFIIYNGSIWQKAPASDAVISVFGRQGVVTAQSGDYTTAQVTESGNLYYTDARARASISVTDTASVDLTYNSGTGNLSAAVLPAGVDHNSLQNYVANQHIDHTAVQIATAADSGLTGGGTIAATRNLTVDINGTTAKTTPANNDSLLIQEAGGNRRSITRANFLSGIPVTSAGDINETSFTMTNNQVTPANITGLAFANATVRSFQALVSVTRLASSNLYEVFTINGVQKGADWDISITSVGDSSGIILSITTTGQIQYTSSNLTSHISSVCKFRALTLTV